ncbi:cyclin-dependent kinase 2-associated protein domain-containing protein [Ditylenchus destructor]|uniref:Cyclin-dependent kinase 2-associated protein domain-containing protein n=1 Tax=Ditylenchus destructor TaxID=166010 RepID=A0AAD4N6H8_9BILA|nr:cyclin-dependent kinase 2-associated protein domain-containing protein [Ditylenchus destructor]
MDPNTITESKPEKSALDKPKSAPRAVPSPIPPTAVSAGPSNVAITNTQQQRASKYSQLGALIEEMGKDIRPTYTGNRNCQERLKRSVAHARLLARECLAELEKNK